MKNFIFKIVFSVIILTSAGLSFATSHQDKTIPLGNVPHSYRGISSPQGVTAPLNNVPSSSKNRSTPKAKTVSFDNVAPTNNTYRDRVVPLNNGTTLTHSYRSSKDISVEMQKLLKLEGDEAMALCNSYIKKYPKEPAFYVYRSTLHVEDLLQRGAMNRIPKEQRDSMYRLSIMDLKKAYAIDSGYVEALDSLSESYYWIEDYSNALKYATKARKIKPSEINQAVKCWSDYKIKNPNKPTPKKLQCPESI